MIVFAGCSQPQGVSSPQSTIQPLADIERSLVNAYALTDPIQRQDVVLQQTNQWLWNEEIQALTNSEAAATYTQLAFSSNNLIFNDPAFIVRNQNQVVMALPNGLGIYLFQTSPLPIEPQLISEYNIGMDALSVTWLEDDIGVAYETLDASERTIPHFALITRDVESQQWEISWLSDEEPKWWFNTLNGSLEVSDDLQSLTVSGESRLRPVVFDETASGITRSYTLTWRRDILRGEDRLGYILSPLPESYNNRSEWLWNAANPSDYATLVQFIERLQLGDETQATTLTARGAAFRQALDFSLDTPGRQYAILEAEAGQVTFQGQQGAFIVRFNAEHQITDIRPIGAQADP